VIGGDETMSEPSATRAPVFYGWWIVLACLLVALVSNALGLFGAGVYLHALSAARGWPIGLVSGAITLFYLVSGASMIHVGGAIARFGPRSIIALGAALLSGGVIGIGHADRLWQAYLAFLVTGLGWACLSTTAMATTLAPWFDRHQGRAIAVASLGASGGGMIGVPLLLWGIRSLGLAATTTLAGLIACGVLMPLAGFVLRRRPEDMGLHPDGRTPPPLPTRTDTPRWTQTTALRTAALRTVAVGFGIGMMAQIGFLTHQVSLIAPSLGIEAAGATVSATAAAALIGRLALARFADRIDGRTIATAVLLLAALALGLLAVVPARVAVLGASLLFGLTVGNVTTLAPIIVRREFGAASFGAVFGVAACAIQLAMAFGPAFYGSLHDMFGSYRPPLLAAAGLDVLAAAIVASGRRPA